MIRWLCRASPVKLSRRGSRYCGPAITPRLKRWAEEPMELIGDIAAVVLLLVLGMVLALVPLCVRIILTSDTSPRRRGKKVKRGRPSA
jgi:hypothetical protein